ncbi:MAG TPA: hypothetical protein QGF05_07705, partial [Dehalococcoidia bacterium]|nr:hypothetical protein [Dehalococcoidia bacterium]
MYVFFVISHARCRIEYVNVTAHPTAAWMWQQMIEATEWNHRPRYLIRDRDRACGREFIARAQRLGIETILTPVRTPQANAVAKRWAARCLASASITSSHRTNRTCAGSSWSSSPTTTRPRPTARSISIRLLGRVCRGNTGASFRSQCSEIFAIGMNGSPRDDPHFVARQVLKHHSDTGDGACPPLARTWNFLSTALFEELPGFGLGDLDVELLIEQLLQLSSVLNGTIKSVAPADQPVIPV